MQSESIKAETSHQYNCFSNCFWSTSIFHLFSVFRDLQGGDSSLAIVSALIRSKAYQNLVDFDNHLDDITQDWLNTAVNKLYNTLTS